MSFDKKSYLVILKTNINTIPWGVNADNEEQAKSIAIKELLDSLCEIKVYKILDIINEEDTDYEERSKKAS
jgi:hypothetical protein